MLSCGLTLRRRKRRGKYEYEWHGRRCKISELYIYTFNKDFDFE